MGMVSDRHCATPHLGEKGKLSSFASAAVSETGTASRIPLRECLEKCFGILFGRTRMSRPDSAIAAEASGDTYRGHPAAEFERVITDLFGARQ
jgi:hypothetical protein